MKVIWRALAALLLLSAGDGSAQRSPVPIDMDLLERHRTAGEPYVRVAGAPREASISLELVIDESGRVAEVQIDPDRTDLSASERGERFLRAARAQLAAWRFRPFERAGRAVPARVGLDVEVVPLERTPIRRIPFPNVPPADVAVTLARGQCFGSCPAYSVTVHGDGRVRFVGLADTLVSGIHDYRIDPADAERLIERFRSSGFWSLDRRYRSEIMDGADASLTVRAGTRTKSVLDYMGYLVGMPAVVTALQDAVDEAADVARFVGGNEHTLAALEAGGFDFRAPAAAALVLASLNDAPEALTLALIARGAPLDLPEPAAGDAARTFRAAVLERAVAKRRPAVVVRLLDDPSAPRLSQGRLDEILAQAARLRSAPIVRRMLALGAHVSPARASTAILADAVDYVWIEPPPTPEEHAEVIRMLIAHGAPVGATDALGMSAIQRAHTAGPEVVRLLVEAGANVDAALPGNPPLLYRTEDEEVALILLSAGADRSLRDEQGRTLEQIARRFDWHRVLALGADRR